jgi:hypothetical protein
MRLISEALTNLKRRRAYVQDRLDHTKRRQWAIELAHIEYAIDYLRGEISMRQSPVIKSTNRGATE